MLALKVVIIWCAVSILFSLLFGRMMRINDD
jgi:hypothetical protein